MDYDVIIVGCGYAGCVCARVLAEKLNRNILIIEKRETIAGNMYDYTDKHGIMIHKYGPHISVMNDPNIFKFLSKFTDWVSYEHHVNAEIDGIEIPLPVNFTSLDHLFARNKFQKIKNTLIETYGINSSVPILKMRENNDIVIRQCADFIYEKVFFHYTKKTWGSPPNQLDPSITARIPIRLSYDNRHFLHQYQVMPKYGFTELFKNMLDHVNITISLNTDAKDVLKFESDKKRIYYKNVIYKGDVIFTGAIDEMFEYVYGCLPYRSLKFDFQTFPQDSIQNVTVLNWPDERPATRRTEMKKLVTKNIPNFTTTITEYPSEYRKNDKIYGEPYYPIINAENKNMYIKYKYLADGFEKLSIVGRLAEYKYYNMEAVIFASLQLLEKKFKIKYN
jgi:UDP-galactopyranose mutase